LISISPLWGTAQLILEEDQLIPYFWGYSISGEKLSDLDTLLSRIDGHGPFTEVDLFLLGKRNLIAVEVKHMSALGRCSRYGHQRCPEVHLEAVGDMGPCRYWETGEQEFHKILDFGERPMPEDPSPPCNRHYQLARTMLVGTALANELDREFSLWLFVPKTQWRSNEKSWLDFTERIRDDELWRRMRVIAWEDLRSLGFP
jgi:hypothetical protein